MDSFITVAFEDLASFDNVKNISSFVDSETSKSFPATTSSSDVLKNEELDIHPGAMCTIC
ncbi:hypothetical protein EST38_g12589 [Candolleomyces aberdarensis]|uniref:Pheromone n=1 Tax=Candolleomyces aberdarensis TaxID=2316362 RepID=A0A4Q2D420_9AGAR|nr:hypothetical protein EST38_g12589 [Candolleomyces aberdarensis]